jgi:hypothetical protein
MDGHTAINGLTCRTLISPSRTNVGGTESPLGFPYDLNCAEVVSFGLLGNFERDVCDFFINAKKAKSKCCGPRPRMM